METGKKSGMTAPPSKQRHRSTTLPEIFVKWVTAKGQAFVSGQLKNRIAHKIKALGLDPDDVDELQKQAAAYDEKYLALQESGDSGESVPFFCRARLLSAAFFLRRGEFHDAVYEYFHSFGTSDPEEVISDMEKVEKNDGQISR